MCQDYKGNSILTQLNKFNAKIIKIDPTNKFTAIVGSNNTILIFDDTYTNVCTFNGHTSFVYDIAFNPDKEKFTLYSASEDNTVRVWDILLKKCLSVLEGHEAPVRHLALTNDGKSLISASIDNNIILWKLANFSIIKKYVFNLSIESIYYFTRIINTANKELIPYLLIGCENGHIAEFNLKNGSNEYRFVNYIEQPIIDLHYSTNEKRIYALTSEQTLLYIDIDILNENIERGILFKLFPCYCQEILDIRLLDSNNYLFSSNDNVLKKYDMQSNSITLYEGHSDFIMNIAIKDKFISTASKDNTIILWYNHEDGIKQLAKFKGHTESVNFTGILLKKKFQLVSASKDQSIKIWDFSHVIENIDNPDSSPVMIKQSAYSVIGHDEEVSVVKVSPNEKLIASAGYDKVVKIWNSYDLSAMNTLSGHKRAVTDLSFSKYAKVLATSSTDKTIKIWNLSDFTCINTLEGHLASVLRVQWVYYGTHIVSAGADGLVKFWNIKTSECINTINAHEGKIWAFDVIETDQNKPKFITGGTDSIITYWKDVTADKEEAELHLLEDKMIKQERLRMLNDNKDYYQAIQLSLELNRKGDFIESIKNLINDRLHERKHEDHISIIINNRKKLDEDSPQDNLQMYKERLVSIIKDVELRKILKSNIDRVLEIIRDNSIKTSNYFYVQILLKMILITTNYENLLNSKTELGLKNKGFKKIKKKKNEIKTIDYIENFEIIKAYSEKHLERINREITKSYIIDYIIEKMKLV